MSPGWQSCPHCKATFEPTPITVKRQRCPQCNKPLRVVAAGPTTPKHQPVVTKRSKTSPQPQRRRSYELYFSFAAILFITLIYVAGALWLGRPKPSGWIGHSLGVVGLLLMLCTETLYSIRKRLHRFSLGRTSIWLQFHIFTGLVGPYLVLLHTDWKFHGLAGVLTGLTIIMVVSGFVGRYIYTAIPRTLDGAELEARELEAHIKIADHELQMLGVDPGASAMAVTAVRPRSGWQLVFGRSLQRWRQKQRLRRAIQDLPRKAHVHAAQLEQLLAERFRLQLQMQSLAGARRLLALWHVFHVPLGVILFLLAFIHVVAALYFATFLK